MAFITLEDLMGSVEVIVFPKNYEADRPGCFNRRLQDLYQGQSVLRR